LAFAQQAVRSHTHQLSLLVLLKTFQRLGYIPKLSKVPTAIVSHIRSCLRLEPQEARALDPAELKDFAPPKRYALLLCLIHRMRVQCRD
jgi:hypothetical protein